jgi:hypothetical protein
VSPSSGTTFPIGVTTVNALATDSCGNSNFCSFTVTVLGAMGVKSNVLAQLLAIQATNMLSQPVAGKLSDAIQNLQNSLNPSYWIDQTHLQPKLGSTAINDEKLAAADLSFIMGSNKSPVDPAVVQDMINRIIKADRLLAIISIQGAAAAGLNARKIAEDTAMVAKGDQAASNGHYADAIEDYRNAWNHSLQMHLQTSVTSTGSAQLQFIGNGAASYVIEVSTNLLNWVPLGTYTPDVNDNVEFIDTNAVSSSGRFYRVVQH